jgi:hypothetical protein
MPAVVRNAKPKTLFEQLSDQAPTRDVNNIVSLERYLMSARLLTNQVGPGAGRKASVRNWEVLRSC